MATERETEKTRVGTGEIQRRRTVGGLIRDEGGSMAVVIAMILAMLTSFASMAIDIGYAMATKAGLETVAKAAALAGARELGRTYEAQTFNQQPAYQVTATDRSTVVAAVQDIAQKNPVFGQIISIPDSDIQIGEWDSGNRTFTATNTTPNAVRIVARRDATSNGPITMFLAHVMGISSLSLSVVDIAALGPVGRVPPGELDLPIAISKAWFTNHSCGGQIKFYPTGDIEGCAGWHSFNEHPPSANTLQTILEGLQSGTFQSPETIVGVTQFEFIGGTVASKFPHMESLYNAMKDANGEWKTFVPVYDDDDCSNPNGPATIVGFTTAIVTQVTSTPDKAIQAILQCDLFETGRPGGPDYGTSASAPTIVQAS